MDGQGKIFTRAQLHELVWSKPMQKLAAEFGLSDVGLAKACRKANIPVPERGYWARRTAGKPTIIVTLPLRFPGASDEVPIGRSEHGYYGCSPSEILKAPVSPEPMFDESIEAVEERVRKLIGRVTRPQNFERTDPHVAKLLSHDDERRVEYARFPSSYNAPRYESGPERRRLLILNALCLAWRRIGCAPSMSTSKWSINDQHSRRVSVGVGCMHVSVSLELISARQTPRVGRKSGERMRLTIGAAFSSPEASPGWEDGETGRIEDCLTDIAIAVVVRAEEAYRKRRVSERESLIRRKAEAERQIIEAQRERERKARAALKKEMQRRIDELLAQSDNLRRAETIRAYVKAVQERATEMGVLPDALEEWASWAASEADRIDPTKNGTIRAALVNGVQGNKP